MTDIGSKSIQTTTNITVFTSDRGYITCEPLSKVKLYTLADVNPF